MADDAQSVSDNAELEDIAKMPIDIELLNLRISRSMRRHGTIGSFIRIIGFIKAVDKVVPGFAGKETLLYSPEIKFYSNKVEIDERFETSVRNLYTLGDGSGWTRGLMQASLMGVLTARNLFSE